MYFYTINGELIQKLLCKLAEKRAPYRFRNCVFRIYRGIYLLTLSWLFGCYELRDSICCHNFQYNNFDFTANTQQIKTVITKIYIVISSTSSWRNSKLKQAKNQRQNNIRQSPTLSSFYHQLVGMKKNRPNLYQHICLLGSIDCTENTRFGRGVANIQT